MVEAKTNRHATGQVGEALVASELARRGYTVAVPTGNAKDIDVLAYKDGMNLAVQVKCVSKGGLQLNLGHFLKIEMDGPRQIVRGPVADLDPDICFSVVFLGKLLGDDRFYFTSLDRFVSFLKKSHERYLSEHGGQRPGKNKESLHAAFKEDEIKESSIFSSLDDFLRSSVEG